MVEIPKDCVLQWAGHAGYITERFSGLLARQALVDVTLICDEQKLRVHKLVLASNSIYFEEILQQDLGQEPIILLKDLDFEILKAMVEFMYCGETTISHQHLSSLHTAAQIFKVKELVSVIDTIDSKKILDDFENCLKQQKGDSSLKVANNSLTEDDYICVRCDKLSMDENTTVCVNSNNNDISSSKNQSSENDMVEATERDLALEFDRILYEESHAIDASKKVVTPIFSTSDVNTSVQSARTTDTVLTHVGMVEANEHDLGLEFERTLYEESSAIDADKKVAVTPVFSTSDVNTSVQSDRTTDAVLTHVSMDEVTEQDLALEFEHTLYEESHAIDASKRVVATPVFSTSDVNTSIQSDRTTSTVLTHVGTVNEVQAGCANSNRDDEVYSHSLDLKPILYEQCCDFSCDVNESDQTTSTLSQSCLPQVENDLEHCSGSSTDVPSTVGKCVKVYTPKRRRSTDEVRNKLVHTQCNLVPTPPHSTDSIDLLDEPSANNVPVTLLTSLDMESAEYILSLSTESIQSIVGGTISDQHTVIGCREVSAERDAAKERLNPPTNGTDCAKPVLRRSTRLSQQESDEAASNGGLPSGSTAGTTEKPFKKGNSPNRTESCAKAKRRAREDRKVPDHSAIAGAVHPSKKSSSKKTNSKLIVRKSNKSACTVTGSSKEREESKPRTNSRFKAENTERLATTADQPAAHHSNVRSNVCKCISRALWGDMSDTLDYWDDEMDLLAYPSNTEIPFAVGLLPLRTALEKMQATPDYQPRKTRSSVAPIKQDAGNCLKRKYCTPSDAVVPASKKQNNGNNNDENPNTVCHIEIRTAPSQCVKSRKRFLSDSITSLPENGPTSQMASNNVG